MCLYFDDNIFIPHIKLRCAIPGPTKPQWHIYIGQERQLFDERRSSTKYMCFFSFLFYFICFFCTSEGQLLCYNCGLSGRSVRYVSIILIIVLELRMLYNILLFRVLFIQLKCIAFVFDWDISLIRKWVARNSDEFDWFAIVCLISKMIGNGYNWFESKWLRVC